MKFRNANPPATEEAISSFEETMGKTLPTDYRSFLLEANGGEQPKPEAFRVASTGEVSFLARFFPVGDGTGRDLLAFWKFLSGSLPENVIPIGQDIGGNYLCIMLGEAPNGSIYFLDHERIDEARKGGLALCSINFASLCSNLFEYT